MRHQLRKAVHDPALKAHIVRRVPLVYAEGASSAEDRPPFVLAASGLATLHDSLFVVQDNANWLAVVHANDSVTATALPRHPSGVRVFSKERGNTDEKVDLEACVVLRGDAGPELVGFGSGTGTSSCWILQVERPDRALAGDEASECCARFFDAGPFYRSLKENAAFSGGHLNIEGATALDERRILILQRGNVPLSDGPVDATGEIEWSVLKAHLEDPRANPPPALDKVIRYELGTLRDVRLTFSDAECLSDGRILFSGSAERPDDGRVTGSVIGLIDPSGATRWTEISCEDGSPFASKIEGLSIAPGTPNTIRFVVDDDDENAPSELFEAHFPALQG